MMDKYERVTVYNEDNIKNAARGLHGGCVVTVGSFDGVHIGHRVLLRALAGAAAESGLPAVAVTFAGNDRPKSQPKLRAQEEKKRALLCSRGGDRIIELPYSAVKDISARDFALDTLAGDLRCKHAVCGYDFRFGRGRRGDTGTLSRVLSERGVPVTVCPPAEYCGAPVSSTRIRSAIAAGEAETARAMLGRPFSFVTVIEKGMRVASRLGVPTANQKFPAELAQPAYGVYAAECVIGGKKYRGVLNFGIKPTFGGFAEPVCETHLFGFSGDIYGMECEVFFLRFLRAEQKFGSESELQSAILRDIAAAKAFFGMEDKTQ
ncbi:MAG: riboflavin biosynthesis protein RibF [Clostridia bacterium]|nr:riboflavin biosynthesis protein RibF [Clostridia bacterium]